MELDGGIQGLIHLSEIAHGVVKDIRDHIKVGEEIQAKVINFEPNEKRIGLSIKAMTPAPEGMEETKTEETDEQKEEKKTKAKAKAKKDADDAESTEEKKQEAPVTEEAPKKAKTPKAKKAE